MITTSEEKMGSKMEALESSINSRLSKLDHMPDMWQLVVIVIGAVFAGIVGVVAVVSFGSDRFNGGVQLTGSTYQQAADAQRISQENARQIGLILDLINRKVIAPPQPKTTP